MSNPLTSFRTGDLTFDVVSKLLRKIGGSPRPDDTEESLWRKIVISLGGVSNPADTLFDSLLKIERLTSTTNFCICGDTVADLLRSILLHLGGSPRPDDSEFDLDVKILAAA